MSRSRELQQHILQLEDIRDIMNSMKNLAFMETSKLTRLLEIQNQIVENVLQRITPQAEARDSGGSRNGLNALSLTPC